MKDFNPSNILIVGAIKQLAKVTDVEHCPDDETCCLYAGEVLSRMVDKADFPVQLASTQERRLLKLAEAMEQYAAGIRRLLERQKAATKQFG